MINAADEFNDRGHLIYSTNYIGAFVRGKSREEALAKFPEEIRSYRRWLGLPVENAEGVAVLQSQASGLDVHDADSDIIFKSELPPLTEEEYSQLKALALKSAADFLALYESVPDKDGTCLSPRKTFYGDVPITARQMYEHTKNVNSYYFGEIGVEAGNGPDIYTCRARGFEELEKQKSYLENVVFKGSYDELWTLRKVCRRFVWHDRIHARAMFRMASRLCGAAALRDSFCLEPGR